MTDAIVTRQLTKCYDGQRVVHGLNLSVPRGSVYGLLGRNGAGKSTTIKMLTGMVHPDFGSIEVLGEDIHKMAPERREKIAYIAENHPLYRWMTVKGALKFAKSFYRNWNQHLVEQILDHFEISGRRWLGRMSNGQRAQVSLAIALAPDPELLILDDPTLGLDTVVRRDFLESMIQIIHQSGRTILMTSHILNDVDRVADRIGIMVGGVLRVDCPTDHFKDSIRRVIVNFDRQPTSRPELRGLVSSRSVKNQLELIIVGYGEEQRLAIESLSPRSVEVFEMNLEDAFIEYTRGPRRSLPSFDMQPAEEPTKESVDA